MDTVKFKFLEEILKSSNQPLNCSLNNLRSIDNLRVILWTFSKTGTSSLGNSFQEIIQPHPKIREHFFQNIIHCHSEECWFDIVSKNLKTIDFTFDFLIDYINYKGIKPLVIQCYRNPLDRMISNYNHISYRDKLNSGASRGSIIQSPSYDLSGFDLKNDLDGEIEYINYLKKTFTNIWEHNYDKNKKIGFYSGDKYNILYVPIEGINALPQNIKSIDELKDYHNIKIIDTGTKKNPGENFNLNYSDFKKNIKFKKELIDQLFKIHKEPLNFFYKDEEIEEMIDSSHKNNSIYD
jgi:hypothetical protein